MRTKHQFNVAIDIAPGDGGNYFVRIAYSYPYTGAFSVGERYVAPSYEDLTETARFAVSEIYCSVARRVPGPLPVRLPHAEIVPKVITTGLTIVLVDQARARSIPLARLYYLESISELGMQQEREIKVARCEWSQPEGILIHTLTHTSKKLAWQEYSKAIGTHLFPD